MKRLILFLILVSLAGCTPSPDADPYDLLIAQVIAGQASSSVPVESSPAKPTPINPPSPYPPAPPMREQKMELVINQKTLEELGKAISTYSFALQKKANDENAAKVKQAPPEPEKVKAPVPGLKYDGNINWLGDLWDAKAEAEKQHKPVLAQWSTSWCGYCKQMERKIFADPAVAKLVSESFIAVKLDGDIVPPEIQKQYKVEGYPTTSVVTPDWKHYFRVERVSTPQQFIKELEKYLTAIKNPQTIKAGPPPTGYTPQKPQVQTVNRAIYDYEPDNFYMPPQFNYYGGQYGGSFCSPSGCGSCR